MNIECKFIFEYPNSDMAKKIRDALEVDNYNFIKTELDAGNMIAHIKSESIMSLLHTTEDYLACLSSAENVITQAESKMNKK